MDPRSSGSALSRRVVVAGAYGNLMEWFDFALFGFLTPLLAVLFFADTETAIQRVIWVWGIAAVGYLMRPIGGTLYGFLGDRYGRRPMLFVSIVGMGLATVAVGFLPTFATSRSFAWASLLVLRLVQGICVGGEFPGSRVYLVEHAPSNRRGLVGCMQATFAAFGVLLASGMSAIVSAVLTHQEVIDWGWRIPFLASAAILIIGLALRIRFPETPVFRRLVESGARPRNPVSTVLRRDWASVLKCGSIVSVQAVSYALPTGYLSTWLTTSQRMTMATALTITTVSQAVVTFLIPLGGWLSDRYGRRPIMIGSALGMGLFAVPMFIWMGSGTNASVTAVLVGQIVVLGLSRLYEAPMGTFMAEDFTPDRRTAGVSVSYNLAAGLVGGTAALLATWLVATTGVAWLPAVYLAILSFAGAIVVYLGMDETAFEPLPAADAQ